MASHRPITPGCWPCPGSAPKTWRNFAGKRGWTSTAETPRSLREGPAVTLRSHCWHEWTSMPERPYLNHPSTFTCISPTAPDGISTAQERLEDFRRRSKAEASWFWSVDLKNDLTCVSISRHRFIFCWHCSPSLQQHAKLFFVPQRQMRKR